ncbi:class F sortase [Streptomyces sp. KLOTTS4A1]|uniref:class F sortase n=1 Tax=Streptomyces sp. KLOTTS4A1 TaxID=3390996 RepID=UPI0039F57C79
MDSAHGAPEAEAETQKKRAPWGVIALVLLTGLALIRNGSGEFAVGPPQPAAAAAAEAGRTVTANRPHSSAPKPLPFSIPERIRIDQIQVQAPIQPVGLDADGWVDAPPAADPNLAGWFTGAVSPGEKGTSVIVGHVDNNQGPAVFYGLGSLKKGNHIEVTRRDGKVVMFEVYGIEVFSKADFPGGKVYNATGSPELRVITCGGGFTKENGYDGNVVVFARMVEKP